ncbi:MAG TPA: hypothetical protein PKD91_14160 [Bacteroidia bacterium]|nr:hypothetical protein [Bacteroidia bacterium]
MATRIQKRRDTSTNWAVNNPILHQGEEGFETDTRKTKTGNGSTAWNSLAYDVSVEDIAPQSLTVVLDTGNVASKEIDMNGYAIQNVGNPFLPGHAANKSYVDDKVVNLRRLLGPIDCSENPDYPAGNVGDTYEVTVAGKIGGADGKEVAPWDEIVCRQMSEGGDELAVGENWYIVQGDVLAATEEISGTVVKATQEEVNAGEEDKKYVTPNKITKWIDEILKSIFQSKDEKDQTDGYAGLTGFMINFINAANTFRSYLSNSNTATRTYGFPDKSGTVALMDDITTEASTRASADSALSTSISTEASTRASADSALSTSISNEATARANADAAIAALHIDVKTSADTTTSGTSFFDVNGLALPIAAGEKIKFDGYIPVECSATNGARLTLTVPSGCTFKFTSTGNGSATTYVSSNIDLGATTESGSMCTLASNQNHIRFIGWIEAGATAGNLQIRIRSGNASNVVKALAGAIISGKKYT